MNKKYNKYRFSFIFGSILIIFLFTIVPLMYSIYLSFFSGRANNLSYSGLNNYLRMIKDKALINALKNTFLFTIILTPSILIISFLLANCINNVHSEKLKSLYSVILFFPSITSPIAYAFFFKQLFITNGFINKFILIVNPKTKLINYLLTPFGARIAIIIVCIWAWSGYYTMFLLSAMQSIDPFVLKVAKLDGLNNFQILYKIKLPIIKPIILFCSILLFGSIFQLFVEVMIISKGGPEGSTVTLSYYIYTLCFQYVPQFGYAASIAILIFIISGVVAFFQFKLGEHRL